MATKMARHLIISGVNWIYLFLILFALFVELIYE